MLFQVIIKANWPIIIVYKARSLTSLDLSLSMADSMLLCVAAELPLVAGVPLCLPLSRLFLAEAEEEVEGEAALFLWVVGVLGEEDRSSFFCWHSTRHQILNIIYFTEQVNSCCGLSVN